MRHGWWMALASLLAPASSLAAPEGAPGREHHLAYYSVADGWSSVLSLNNAEPGPLTVTVVLHSRNGEALTLPASTLAGNSTREIALGEAVAGRPEFAEGSVALRFVSRNRFALGAQLTLVHADRRLGLDLEPAMHLASSTLEGLWWSLDAGSEVRIHFANTTDEPVTVTPRLELRGENFVLSARTLAPRALVTLDLRTELVSLGRRLRTLGQGGLTLDHDGPAGAIVAHGALFDRGGRYSANLPLIDPAGVATSTFDGTGLVVGRPEAGSPFPAEARFKPFAVLRNLSPAEQTVQWRVAGRADAEETRSSTVLGPREVRRVELTGAPSAATSLALESSAPPGALVAVVASLDRARGLVVDVPLASVRPASALGGNHPFRIEDGARSVAYLTNTTDQPTTASYLLVHDRGQYSSGLLRLAPRETVTVDFQALRDNSPPDAMGRTLPRDLERGQILWAPREPNSLVGRVVRFDLRTGRTTNFSCPNCCGPFADYYAFRVEPFAGWPGGFQSMEVDRYDRWCGWPDGPYRVTEQLAFSSENPGIATATVGQVQYVAPGTTSINVEETLWYSDNTSAEDCGWFPYQSTGTCPVDTNPTVRITGPQTVPMGTLNSVTLTATGTPGEGTFSWSTTSDKISLSATSGASITVTAVKESAAENDSPVSVTYTVNGITTSPGMLALTVRKPTSLRRTGTDTTSEPRRCTTSGGSAGCGVNRTFVYQVVDHLGKDFALATSTGGVTFYDSIATVSGQNGCNLGGYNTTCPTAAPCSQKTFGTFNETLSICAPACRSGTRCITGCTTNATQKWFVNGIEVATFALSYQCNRILVDGN